MTIRNDWPATRHRTHALIQACIFFVLGVIVFLVIKRLAPILTPVVAASAIAYLLNPLVERLVRARVPRAAAVALVLGGLGLLALLVVAVLVPLVVSDVRQFLPQVPRLAERLFRWIEEVLHVRMPGTARQAVDQLVSHLGELFAGASGPLVRSIAVALGSVFTFLAGLLQLLLIPVLAFYVLLDWPRLVAGARDLIPSRYRSTALGTLSDIDGVLSSWVRGQLVVCGIQAVLYAVALSSLGIQLAVPIGLLAGLLSLIPYVGMGVGLGLALLMALLDWHGVGRVVGVGLVFMAVQLLESLVLTPRLVGRKVGLSEAGALLAVIAGAELLGFIGMMLAVPLAASVAVVARRFVRSYRESKFYKEQAERTAS
ncbi:MAG: AI-2E family transporter [Deltaproteobacteria bacterium]|nr:AI-2E family transporter [Deltaproteobacteria bacterium]